MAESLLFGLLTVGVGISCVGRFFAWIGERMPPEIQARYRLPWVEAVQPPEGTPARLRMFRDWEHRARINQMATSVTIAKVAPVLREGGLGLATLAAMGLVLTTLI
jgi:hypothetical protein